MPPASDRPAALGTGAAGFIGSHLTRALVAGGRVRVVALDDLSGGFRDNLPADVEFVEGSVTDAALVGRLFEMYGIRYVFHLAAYAAEGLSHFIRRFNYTNNVIGIFMNQIMQGRPMTTFGDGTQQRAFSYVGDIVPAMAASPWVPAAAGEVFNIGADHPYTVNELARTIAAAMGAPNHPIEHLA